MRKEASYLLLLLAVAGASNGCTRSFECNDSQIQPAFVGFAPADIDTFVLRKFKANSIYQTLLDTFVVKRGLTGSYRTLHDTTVVAVQEYWQQGIRAGYDWQLVLPAVRRVVLINNIDGERKTGECTRGLFSMDPFSCQCENKLFSAEADGKLLDFSQAYFGEYKLVIRK